jgi:hypothetical protein
MSQQILNNTGTNYTLYYNVVNYFKTIMGNHPSIGAASYGDLWDIGEREFPQYPIANIQILNTEFGENVTNYSVQIIVADKQKNKNNESTGIHNEQTIPFSGVDDAIDIYSNTLAIINDLTSYTQRGVAGFEINDDIRCTPFADRFDNGLAGWVAEFTLTTHNDRNRCLFFLVKPEEFKLYLIQSCSTGEQYIASLNQATFPVGKTFTSVSSPGLSPIYANLVCYTVIQEVTQGDIDFANLPVLPPGALNNCAECFQWITPGKVWSTIPGVWKDQYQKWINI